MRKLLLGLSALILLTSCGSIKKYNQEITSLHAVEDLHSDIDKVYQQLQKHHPKLYQYISKVVLDTKFDSLKATIITPINSRDFYKKLAPIIANVKQGHVSLGTPSKRYTKKERKQLKKQKFQFYDLGFEYLDKKLWITTTHGEDSTIIGSEVIKIEDDLATDLVEIYKTRFASDGYNQTLHNRYVGKVFSSYYFRDKGFLDSLSMTLKLKDSVFNKTFRRIEKEKKQDSLDKKITKPKLSEVQKKENRIAKKAKRKYDRKHGFISKSKLYTRDFRYLEEDSTVAYMKIRSFGNGNYRRFYKESFATLDSAKTKNFILDLRDNGGGRIAEIDFLYSFLTAKNYEFIEASEVNSRLPFMTFLMSNTTPNSIKIASGLLAPFIVAHNLIKTNKHNGKIYYKFSFSNEKMPRELNYKGNLYVLINGNSFSASSLISTHLKANKRAVFVGEETGGAYNGCVAGIYKIYELPKTKLKIRMGLMQIETKHRQNPDGFGVKPDFEVIPIIEDRLLKRDAELDWVLDAISSKK
jgi:hypothetical protein